jgi:hypothetical protein
MDLLSLFEESRSHLAMVTPNPLGCLECMRNGARPTEKEAVLGIVTMEDVLEKMIQREIIDETDVISHSNPSKLVNPTMLLQTPGLKRRSFGTGNNRNSFSMESTKTTATTTATTGINNNENSRRLSANYRRTRIFANDSVVSSGYFDAARVEHFGLEKQDSSDSLSQVASSYWDIWGKGRESSAQKKNNNEGKRRNSRTGLDILSTSNHSTHSNSGSSSSHGGRDNVVNGYSPRRESLGLDYTHSPALI